MMSFKSRRGCSRVALAALLGLTVTVGCMTTAARAADSGDDDENVLLDTKIVRGILKGLGLRKDENPIEYRERSPLVLPTNNDLPPPETTAPSKTAGWPDDPDIKQARQRKQAERNRKAYVEGEDDRPLRPSEYEISSRKPRDNASGPTTDDTSRPMSNAALGVKNIFTSVWGSKEEYATFTGEPPRTSLVDPPPGYRTPSPDQPFGVGKEKWKAPVIDRQEPAR